MKRIAHVRKVIGLPLLIFASSVALSACNNYLVFTTATKFAIDVSQEAGQPPKISLGYKRAEVAIIPAKHENASDTKDTYSVLGDFCARVDPSLKAWWDGIKGNQNVPDSLQIRSIFITGIAAQEAASDDSIRAFFEKTVKERSTSGSADKQCF